MLHNRNDFYHHSCSATVNLQPVHHLLNNFPFNLPYVPVTKYNSNSMNKGGFT